MRCPYTRAAIDCERDDDGRQCFHCRGCGEIFTSASEPAEACERTDEEPEED